MTPRSQIKARQARRDFARLAAQTDEQLSRGDALARAAMLIAAEEQANAPFDVADALAALEQMAAEVRRQLAEIGPGEATEPHEILNHFLFEEMGFAGDQEDYYDPRNSLLNLVVERRRGIPITLSLVYMEVGRRAGLSVEGVGMPGH
ncbi:MAG TPA: transglutaminase-like domain-containing protein, partial [Pyrinomonadaceae bacterium]|nr:transglutaminase-like domain-containing protein [Pyrinomonadaceae bacterium]